MASRGRRRWRAQLNDATAAAVRAEAKLSAARSRAAQPSPVDALAARLDANHFAEALASAFTGPGPEDYYKERSRRRWRC